MLPRAKFYRCELDNAVIMSNAAQGANRQAVPEAGMGQWHTLVSVAVPYSSVPQM